MFVQVFVDTPGFVSHTGKAFHSVEKSLLVDSYASVEEVDVGKLPCNAVG